MHATADRSSNNEAQRAWWDDATFGLYGRIGKENARCIVADGAAAQRFPGHAVGIDRPVTDHPSIEEVEPFLARRIDLSILLGDQHRLALMDGDLRGANLYPERHTIPPGWTAPYAARYPDRAESFVSRL